MCTRHILLEYSGYSSIIGFEYSIAKSVRLEYQPSVDRIGIVI